MKKYVILLISIFVLVFAGCAPSQFEPYEPPKVDFEETEKYDPDFSELEKPDKPEFVYLDGDFEKVDDPDKAEYAALANDDLKKILTLSKQYDAQAEVIGKQTDLVNTHVDQINALKEIVEMKEVQMEQYISLYTTAQNRYLQEQHEHRVSNLKKDVTMYIMTIGAIAIAIVAL